MTAEWPRCCPTPGICAVNTSGHIRGQMCLQYRFFYFLSFIEKGRKLLLQRWGYLSGCGPGPAAPCRAGAWRLQQLRAPCRIPSGALGFLPPSPGGGELPITGGVPRAWATLGRELRHQTLAQGMTGTSSLRGSPTPPFTRPQHRGGDEEGGRRS